MTDAVDVAADLLPSTFGWPTMLLALLVLPLVAIAYVWQHRRARRAAARFANPDLLPDLIPRRPGWRRHLPPTLLLLALASLLVGAARPQRVVTQDIRAATVVLAVDSSNSMMATDVRPSRLEAAKVAARTMVGALPPNGRIGIVSFARVPTTLNPPTGDRAVIESSLDALRISGGTAVGDALVQSLAVLEAAGDGEAEDDAAPGAIVLLTDGANTEGTVDPLDAAAQARAAGVPVFTVSLGTAAGTFVSPNTGAVTPAPPDPPALAAIARAAGGAAYTADDAAELVRVYDAIGRRIGTEERSEDLSVAFLGLGALLTLLSSSVSLHLFRRPI